jgi:hypothetical protein
VLHAAGVRGDFLAGLSLPFGRSKQGEACGQGKKRLGEAGVHDRQRLL